MSGINHSKFQVKLAYRKRGWKIERKSSANLMIVIEIYLPNIEIMGQLVTLGG